MWQLKALSKTPFRSHFITYKFFPVLRNIFGHTVPGIIGATEGGKDVTALAWLFAIGGVGFVVKGRTGVVTAGAVPGMGTIGLILTSEC